MPWNRKERLLLGGGRVWEVWLYWGGVQVIFQEGYLSSGLALRQDQLLDEDNGGHLVPFRNTGWQKVKADSYFVLPRRTL